MNKYTVVADVLGIIICCVILYGTLFETKSKDKRRVSLVYTILFLMVQSGFNILDCLSSVKTKSYWLMACIYMITGVGSLIETALYMNYMRYVIENYKVDIAKKIKALTIYVFSSVCIVAIMLSFKLIFYIDDGKVVNLPGFYIFKALMFGGYFFYFLIVFSIKKKISKRVYLILLGYIFLPIFINAILSLILPGCIFGFSIMAITLVLLYVMLQSNIQYASEQEKLDYFKSMSEVYHSLYVFDLENRSFLEFGVEKAIHNYVNKNKESDIQEIMKGIMTTRICEAHRAAVIEFTDFSTLEERMKGSNMIDIEVIDVDKKWLRFRFIRIGKEEDGLKKVFFASLDIDESKRKENELILMSNTDQLTNLYNRNAYETYIKKVEVDGIPDDLVYMGCDLNGLKEANDMFGHDAGDELIIKTAEYLTEAFADYGKVYRIGGDEFAVILQATTEEYKKMLAKLRQLQTNWNGSFDNELSCSIGMVSAKEAIGKSIVEMRKIADQRMYKCKREYYKIKGRDRRGHKNNYK